MNPMRLLLFILAFVLPFEGFEKKRRFASIFSQSSHPTVVIDPGHGGTDRGAREKWPYCEEKRVSLLTSRLIKKHLDHLGYKVIMTRDSDIFIPLSKRVEIAKAAACSIFVSIHFNSSRNASAKGIEIFFCDQKSDPQRSKLSKKLADFILPKLIRRTEANSRGVKKGNFYVIRETSMPAILIEGGFISNPEERAQLKLSEYQEKIARGVAEGIDHYFKKVQILASR